MPVGYFEQEVALTALDLFLKSFSFRKEAEASRTLLS